MSLDINSICSFVTHQYNEFQKTLMNNEAFCSFVKEASHTVETIIEDIKKSLSALSERVSTVFSTAHLICQAAPSEEAISQLPLSLHDIKVRKLNGDSISLSDFKDRSLLIVNIASKCGLAGQMDELEELQKTFKDQPFSILAFPSDDFLGQEPGTPAEIQERYEGACKLRSFQVLGKVKVGGENRDPLYLYLTSAQRNPNFSGNIQWNFTKFLVNPNGQIVDRFAPTTSPTSDTVKEAIKKSLPAQ